MHTVKFYRFLSIVAVFVFFQAIFVFTVKAQETAQIKPELKVAGIELGNRSLAEDFLKNGYSPRVEDDGRVAYYFYNKWANQVLKLSAPSIEDKYFITEIEVFRVNRKYRERHFQLEDTKFFETESGIFIGFKQSAMFLIAGIKNAGSTNEFKPKHIIKMQGEPTERIEPDKKYETLIYRIADLELKDEKTRVKYEAKYEFYKNKLKRFSLKIIPNPVKPAKI
jgi:hypothetical protein